MVGWLKAPVRCAISCCGLGLLLGAVATARAQDSVKPDPAATAQPAQNQQPAPGSTAPQLPGAGAQVRTGSQFGDGDKSLVNRLARLLADHQFLEMEDLLGAADNAAPDAPGRLTSEQKQLFRGVLANRENQPQESIRVLEPLLQSQIAGQKGTAPMPEEKLLRKTLAEDYLRAGDWPKANQAYLEFEFRLGGGLSPEERDEIEAPVKLLPLVIANPPMTVEAGDPFVLPYDRDALGLTDVPVFVDAQSHDWMLDPTAPFNLICRTTAKEVGLKVSEQSATVNSITGRPMLVHATVIPRFTIGTVTYRNMTAFVFEDADYYFPKSKYQVRGVLGYPAVSALGSLTITADAQIEVQPGEKGERLTSGARFFLDGDRIIAALGKAGDERMFAVDASGQQTYLTSRYYAEHAGEFADKKMQLLSLPGMQNRPPVPAHVADAVTLQVGTTPITLHYAQVLTQPLGNAAVDDTYGTLGMDALDELKSYTFDYRTMRFSVKNE
jgi:hypothetical protein